MLSLSGVRNTKNQFTDGKKKVLGESLEPLPSLIRTETRMITETHIQQRLTAFWNSNFRNTNKSVLDGHSPILV